MTITAKIAALLVAVFIATLYIQRLFERAAAQHAGDQRDAEAIEAADWIDDLAAIEPTPEFHALLAEERYLPLHDAIARAAAYRLDDELFELLNGEER